MDCPPNEEAEDDDPKAGGTAEPEPPKLKLGLVGVAAAPPEAPKAKGEAVLLEAGAAAAALLPEKENGDAAAVGLLAWLSCFPKANIPPLLLELVEVADPKVLEDVVTAADPAPKAPNPPDVAA